MTSRVRPSPDPLTVALQVVDAVHTADPEAVRRLLPEDTSREAAALVRYLAGMVHPDAPVSQLKEAARTYAGALLAAAGPGAPTRRDRCGTPAGYKQHSRAGERACRDCLDAQARYRAQFARTRAEPVRCGTNRAYQRHLSRGQSACQQCKQAHAEAEARRRQERKAS